MDVPEVSQRFGLMLEAYLRGSVNHINELRREMDAIGKLRSISELLHSRAFKDRVSFYFFTVTHSPTPLSLPLIRTRKRRPRRQCYSCYHSLVTS